MHERTSPQIGEHITVFTSVCLKNMQRGDTAGMVCTWPLAELEPVTCCLVTEHPGYSLDGPDKNDRLVRASVEFCGCRLHSVEESRARRYKQFLAIGFGTG